MQIKNFFAQDLSGNVISSPEVIIFQPGTTTLVSGLENVNGDALTNPFTGLSSGQIVFAAPNGIYDMKVVGSGRTITMRVEFFDGNDLSSTDADKGAALVKLDATKNYVAGTIGAALNDICINVRLFPWLAKGDGVTDDWPSILAAVKFIGSKGGGRLHFPATANGYRISKAIPFVNGLQITGEGYASFIRPLDSSTYGVLGEAYPSRFCEINGWTANIRFNRQYDATIAGYQNSDGSVSRVSVDNLRIDGNKAAVSFNTHNAGSADDAYQNAIRLDCVQFSKFTRLWIDNAVFNAISNYDSSDDNLFEDIFITGPGKSGIGAGLSANGIYIESTSKRTKFRNVQVNGALMFGVLVKAASGIIEDVDLDGITCINCPLDGIRIGDDAATSTGSLYRVTVRAPRVINCGTTSGYTGIRVAHSGSGTINHTKIDEPYVAGGGAAGGIAVQAGAVMTFVLGGTVTGVSSDGYRALTGSTDTHFIICASSGNTGAHFNTTGATRAFVVFPVISGVATSDFYQTPRVTTGNGTAAKFLWDQSGIGQWEAGIAASTNRWYLYGLGNDQISIDSNGMKVGASGGKLGFYAGTPVAKPTISGSRGGGAALASLLTALASMNLITDSTTA